MTRHCCYGTCKNDSRYNKEIKFIQFPQPLEKPLMSKRWIQLCGRKNFDCSKITKYTYICTDHFPENEILDIWKNPKLEPFPAHNEKAAKLKADSHEKRAKRIEKRREKINVAEESQKKKNVEVNQFFLPDQSNNECVKSKTTNEPNSLYEPESVTKELLEKDQAAHCSELKTYSRKRNQEVQWKPYYISYPVECAKDIEINTTSEAGQNLEISGKKHVKDINFYENKLKILFFVDESEPLKKKRKKEVATASVQVDNYNAEIRHLLEENKRLQSIVNKRQSVCDFLTVSEEKAKFYTGLNKEHRLQFFDLLGNEKSELTMIGMNNKKSCNLTISIMDQYLLTLMILRQGYSYKDVGFRFNLSRGLVSSVFRTWIQFFYLTFYELRDVMFVKQSDIKKPLPKCFRNSILKDTRIVIDCTEIFVESSKDYTEQGLYFSNYKHHTTAKILIGCAPSGACMFVSDCFKGSISDRQIVEESGFLNFIEKNDLVLADRGFQIHDLLSQKQAKLLIPPFLKRKSHLSLKETKLTRILAKARIHIERFNQRLKQWKLLSGIVPKSSIPILSQSVYVCCMLTNFQEPLAK